jgi:hypothetical protein
MGQGKRRWKTTSLTGKIDLVAVGPEVVLCARMRVCVQGEIRCAWRGW